MASIDLLLDTSILIDVWRGNQETAHVVEMNLCGVDTIAYGEFLQCVNYRQREKADQFLGQFELIAFRESISFKALNLLRSYSHAKGLRVGDAIVAATAIEMDIALFSLNKRHFKFIDRLSLI